MLLKPLPKPKFAPADPTPDQMARIADGARMAHMLPYLKDSIQKQMNAVQTRVFAAITNGTFTPEQAYAAWYEMNANHNMLKRVTVHVTLGTAAAETHSETLTIGEPDGN